MSFQLNLDPKWENCFWISGYLHSVLKCFKNEVLPKLLDLKIILQKLSFQIILLQLQINFQLKWSASYNLWLCYNQKSANKLLQWTPYSEQQKKSLYKSFTICTMDGFILDVTGPFPPIKKWCPNYSTYSLYTTD